MNSLFFADMRTLFGPLNQGQVDGVNTITAELAIHSIPIEHSAYILATAWHETAGTLQPIEEYGHGKGHAYGLPVGPWHNVYDGRGDVQLTWENNYQLATLKLREHGVIGADIDLDKNPELAMRPDIAAAILVLGMIEGWFTGKKLSDYTDFVNMRRVVNGTDRADLIAQYAIKFEHALKASGWVPAPVQATPAPPPSTVSAVPLQPTSKPVNPIPVAPVGSGAAAPPKVLPNPMPRIMAAIMSLVAAFVFWYTSH